EVAIAIESLKLLGERGITGKVVSVPSMELFSKQSEEYRREVIGNPKAKVAIEAGIAMSWHKLLGENGRFVGMQNFGASAPAEALYEFFGITPKAVVEAVAAQL